MAQLWKEDQKYLLDSMLLYRQAIHGKQTIEPRKLTEQFARNLHDNTPELHHRSVQSINERLPYLDNLLAGALEIHNYAKKDQHLYFTAPRENDNRKFNICNTRHSYNGALRKKSNSKVITKETTL